MTTFEVVVMNDARITVKPLGHQTTFSFEVVAFDGAKTLALTTDGFDREPLSPAMGELYGEAHDFAHAEMVKAGKITKP